MAERAAGEVPLELGGGNVQLFGEETDRLGQRADGDYVETFDDGTFLGVLRRHDEAAHFLVAGGQSHGEDALGRPHGAIEGQLAGGSIRRETGRGELSAGA